MSFARLLPEDRKLSVHKIYDEMNSNTAVNTPDGENKKTYFLQLVEGNEELSEIEKTIL